MDAKHEWDEAKRFANIAKRHIDFTAAESFDWDAANYEQTERFMNKRSVGEKSGSRQPATFAIGFI